jgi:hypothetical protein
MGKLGRRRVFLVRPTNAALKLPTDLAEVTVLEHAPSRRDGNIIAALGTACHRIRQKDFGGCSDVKYSQSKVSKKGVSVPREGRPF